MVKSWGFSTMETYFGDDTAMDRDRCQVRITDSEIEVFYEEEEIDEAKVYGKVYRGAGIGQGHFGLNAQDGDGDAILRRVPDGRILVGWWTESGLEGKWRIILSDAP
jgi:hypothetical protein